MKEMMIDQEKNILKTKLAGISKGIGEENLL